MERGPRARGIAASAREQRARGPTGSSEASGPKRSLWSPRERPVGSPPGVGGWGAEMRAVPQVPCAPPLCSGSPHRPSLSSSSLTRERCRPWRVGFRTASIAPRRRSLNRRDPEHVAAPGNVPRGRLSGCAGDLELGTLRFPKDPSRPRCCKAQSCPEPAGPALSGGTLAPPCFGDPGEPGFYCSRAAGPRFSQNRSRRSALGFSTVLFSLILVQIRVHMLIERFGLQ